MQFGGCKRTILPWWGAWGGTKAGASQAGMARSPQQGRELQQASSCETKDREYLVPSLCRKVTKACWAGGAPGKGRPRPLMSGHLPHAPAIENNEACLHNIGGCSLHDCLQRVPHCSNQLVHLNRTTLPLRAGVRSPGHRLIGYLLSCMIFVSPFPMG